MDPKYFGIFEAVFSFIVIMGFLGWQYWSLRDTGDKKDSDKQD